MRVQFSSVTVQQGNQAVVSSLDWLFDSRDCWAVLGTNGCGKSSLGRLLAGDLRPSSGLLHSDLKHALWVSLEQQQSLYERELYQDDTDFIDRLDQGSSVRALLEEITPWGPLAEKLVDQLELTAFLQRGYRVLSTGEGRRLMLARALLAKPDLLILDEPFEGLDAANRAALHATLGELTRAGQAILLLINQSEDLPPSVTHLAVMDQGRFLYQGRRPSDINGQWQHLLSLKGDAIQLPARPDGFQWQPQSTAEPLLVMTNGWVRYADTYQFKSLDWTLLPGAHTQITGPNGCGKSTLLGLITGDHPQCYANDLVVLGFRRGSGESIWQIKKHIGYVSGSLHRDYRVAGNLFTAVLSGLTDSIGLYQPLSDAEKALASQWLGLIGLKHKANQGFKQLSIGEQRLVLIARALIKQPPLLILDEPTQGLDDFNRFYVLEIVEKIIQHSRSTLLFVSHRQDETLPSIQQRLSFVPAAESDCLYQVVVMP